MDGERRAKPEQPQAFPETKRVKSQRRVPVQSGRGCESSRCPRQVLFAQQETTKSKEKPASSSSGSEEIESFERKERDFHVCVTHASALNRISRAKVA